MIGRRTARLRRIPALALAAAAPGLVVLAVLAVAGRLAAAPALISRCGAAAG